MAAQITRDGNKVQVIGDFGVEDLHVLLATIHTVTEKQGYSELALDFSECSAAFAPSMLAMCAQVGVARSEGISVQLSLPTNDRLAKLFLNTNWAHFLDPKHPQSRFRGFTQVPATRFSSPAEQALAVNTMVDAILGSVSGLNRSEIAALEWALNEITDNVLVHAQSDKGGLVQVSMFQTKKRRIEFVVCDSGLGVPKTLRTTHSEIRSDSEALERAIRENVTRDKSLGQGNGLFGSFEICRISGGYFHLHSGYATLSFDQRYGLHSRGQHVPYNGTLVVGCIDCSQPGILQHALKFGGRVHVPIDFIETRYESEQSKRIDFVMKKEADSFGSRLAGQPIRNKLNNIAEMCRGQAIHIDFQDIAVVSSSFADEVFGKLFVEFGPLRFSQTFRFLNVSETVQQIVDRAILQRKSG